MKVPIGPHQREGKRRRRLKAIIIALILAALVATTSLCIADKTIHVKPPLPSEIGRISNIYRATGYCGEAKAFLEDHPDYSYIMWSE